MKNEDTREAPTTMREHFERSGRQMTAPATLNDIAEAHEFAATMSAPASAADVVTVATSGDVDELRARIEKLEKATAKKPAAKK